MLAANLLTDEVRLWRVHTALENVTSAVDTLDKRAQARQLRDRFVFANRVKLRDAGIYIRSGAGDELPYYSPSVIREIGERLEATNTDKIDGALAVARLAGACSSALNIRHHDHLTLLCELPSCKPTFPILAPDVIEGRQT